MPEPLPTREEIAESQEICNRALRTALVLREEAEAELLKHARTALPERNRQLLSALDQLAEKEREIERLREQTLDAQCNAANDAAEIAESRLEEWKAEITALQARVSAAEERERRWVETVRAMVRHCEHDRDAEHEGR